MEYAIQTDGLCKEFDGFRAVDDVSLRVERGAFYGFLGPNGAGKSTTIKILTGLMGPTAGAARVLGADIHRDGLAVKQRIGIVPEDLCLFENLTAREYLTFIGRMYRLPRPVIEERREELLSLLGLESEAKKLLLEFSHGMQKKVALAAALIHDPDVLFLDEPFEGLDALASRTIRLTLERFVGRESTIFLSSHILAIVERLCSHVGIIHRGKLVTEGPLAELAAEGSLEQAFIDLVGEPEQTSRSLSWLEGNG